jgi:hypothetical protein
MLAGHGESLGTVPKEIRTDEKMVHPTKRATIGVRWLSAVGAGLPVPLASGGSADAAMSQRSRVDYPPELSTPKYATRS